MNKLRPKNRWKATWNRRRNRHRNRWAVRLRSALLVLAAPPVLMIAGCSGCNDSSIAPGPGGADTTGQLRKEFLDYAINDLDRLDEFNTGKMVNEIIGRIKTLVQLPEPPPDWTADRLMATCPQPEMLREIVKRLNQWIRSQDPPDGWKPDPLLDDLPDALKELPQVKDLGKMEFSPYDGLALREGVWLRDVSGWAPGETLDDLDIAGKLFDWTVRNVQLDEDSPGRIPLVPWETLLFGRGTAMERARLFILLARQQGFDAALLALEGPPAARGSPGGRGSRRAEKPRPWAVAVLIEGELYLFDPALGLPIPGPDGVKLSQSGQLDIRPATLAQVVADDRLLRQLDVAALPPYPVRASDLKRLVVLLEASPTSLAVRMKLVQSRLAGRQKMVLITDPTAQAKRLEKSLEALPEVAGAKLTLWTLPFETIGRRLQLKPPEVRDRLEALLPFYLGPAPLRKGRMLYLKGELTGRQGAARFYQSSRPADRELDGKEKQLAAFYYQMERKTHRQLAQEEKKLAGEEGKLTNQERELAKRRIAFLEHSIRQVTAGRARDDMSFYRRAKQDASYWLGLVAFQRANYPSAIDYFAERTLGASPRGPWTHGARYNLARAFEASGQSEKAIQQYKADTTSPAHHGNLLRARWLSRGRP